MQGSPSNSSEGSCGCSNRGVDFLSSKCNCISAAVHFLKSNQWKTWNCFIIFEMLAYLLHCSAFIVNRGQWLLM